MNSNRPYPCYRRQAGVAVAVILLAVFFWPPPAPAQEAEPHFPPRLQRDRSFLGIHFDFHAGPDCKEIGKNTTREMVENIINQVHPDYLQIDCKGHRGLSSYPTKVGNQAPGFVGDPLRLWRQVTAERGVALYMHYSGVWDSEAIRLHPDWAAIDAGGKTNGNATSFWSPYADQLLVPQLRELAGDYGVDGAWIDGECWASVPDYGDAAVAAFKAATGIAEVPRKPGEPHWFEWLQFNREAFRSYLRHYIAAVKQTNPDFQLCSNWAFTDHMAEAVSAPVDFLSGDYSPEDSVNSARLSGRYLARQGKPWDLMAWSFSRNPGKNGGRDKTPLQLEREAAVVIALGGGFQAYFKQKRDGSIYDERMPVMAEVARFCRARQAVCHRSEAVPQVALLLSTAAHYRAMNGLFQRNLNRVHGSLQALLGAQLSVEVVGEHQLTGRLAEYPLIVIPEWDYLEPAFRAELVGYVNGGGDLLLIGPGSAALFETELGVRFTGEQSAAGEVVLTHNGASVPMNCRIRAVEPGAEAAVFGTLQRTGDAGGKPQPAATIRALGRGRIAAAYFTFGNEYLKARPAAAGAYLNDLVRQLFPQPMVTVTGCDTVDVALARNHGKLLVNLVNCSGPHQSEPIIEEISPTGPLSVTLYQQKQPGTIMLEPGHTPLAYTFENGVIRLTVPPVAVHSVVVVEP